MEKIKEIYSIYKYTPSDINEHLETIFNIAQECSHITEMGVRGAVSTWAMLLANPQKMISYDISYHNYEVDRVITLANEYKINYKFVLADVLKLEIEPTELLFIDTLHTYNQLLNELNLHASKVSKYIVLHDTESFGIVDEEIYPHASNSIINAQVCKKGLLLAIEDFLLSKKGESWEVFKRYTHNNGLTILRKKRTVRYLNDKKDSENNLNKWNTWYTQLPNVPSEFYYGDTVSYKKAAEFLEDCMTVEDWGVGAGGFLRYRPDAVGIDGSTTHFAKKQNVDLKYYTSTCEGICMRHVLEHNYSWDIILQNMLKSATKKVVIVLFIPLSEGETTEIAHNSIHGIDVPDLLINKQEFLNIIKSFKPKAIWTEKVETDTAYKIEELYYIEL